ncbi:hypothetical protein E2C01_100137 [Portunus trituberculatus]|uniref:Uncharacterized protein n=1 Tax=Portunus trituberculatus TaxID=210409 RepID=A0A5B7KC75_PORTR|nr:hypothetical protein [Portunus trituberculatus]
MRACRIILDPAYTDYDHTLSTLNLPTLATRHQTALVRMGRGLLRHPRLRHLLPPTLPSQPMPHDTQTWSHHLRPQEPTVVIIVLSPPRCEP